MEQVSVVGLALAKSVFQVHGVNAQGEAVLRRRLTRSQLLQLFERLPPCLVGMEARRRASPDQGDCLGAARISLALHVSVRIARNNKSGKFLNLLSQFGSGHLQLDHQPCRLPVERHVSAQLPFHSPLHD
jgi:transposase